MIHSNMKASEALADQASTMADQTHLSHSLTSMISVGRTVSAARIEISNQAALNNTDVSEALDRVLQAASNGESHVKCMRLASAVHYLPKVEKPGLHDLIGAARQFLLGVLSSRFSEIVVEPTVVAECGEHWLVLRWADRN